jgi:di/tricarboxylate transporter
MMLTAMACAPFMHNAPTVLILAPVAIGVARHLHLSPDPLLMGVATGAACDFLTPVGHQCNTLVLGPGGYKFSDYTRLGGPPKAGIYVSCVARGAALFGEAGVETALIREGLGEFPLIGFFANGEISRDRLYGHTGVLTLFT